MTLCGCLQQILGVKQPSNRRVQRSCSRHVFQRCTDGADDFGCICRLSDFKQKATTGHVGKIEVSLKGSSEGWGQIQMYKSSTEMQSQKSRPQKRAGRDEWPMWKVLRSEEKLMCLQQQCNYSEGRGQLGCIYLERQQNIPLWKTAINRGFVLLVSLFMK